MRPNQLLAGRYRLEKRIGAGGMGEVWRAHDATLERSVAVKVLHPAMADDAERRQRFLREARTVAALNAPGVVALFDTGEEITPDGARLPYLVMEFVVGRPLSSYVPEALPPFEVMRLVSQVARGLDAAHRVGIVHRDVKAANILVNRHGDATLVDFGIARRTGETGLTTTGSVMGTVEYAAPEQLRDEQLTGASDVYSLGVVAYECLAGRRPFDGQSVAAVIAGHLTATPPPLPDSVPPAVARVVMRALAKQPIERYGTAVDFARACRDAATDTTAPPRTRPLPSHPVPEPGDLVPAPEQPTRGLVADLGEPPPRRGRRGLRTLAVIGAVVAVLATVGVVLFTMDTKRDSAQDQSPGGAGESSFSTTEEQRKPAPSVLVSAENTLCLLSGKRDGSAQAVKARMGLCQNAQHPEYTFDSVGDGAVAIRFTSELGGAEVESCLGVDTTSVSLLADDDCSRDTAWSFTYLRTEDGVEYWQLSSHVDGGLCLHAGAEKGDPAYVEHCDGGAPQQWRTDAAA